MKGGKSVPKKPTGGQTKAGPIRTPYTQRIFSGKR